MDDQTRFAATGIMFPDPGESQQWFETIKRVYEELQDKDSENAWEEFKEKLRENYGSTADEFAQIVESIGNPMDIIKGLAEADVNELVQAVQEAMQGAENEGQEGEGQEFDQAAWEAFLQTLQGIWDGTEDTWQQFLDWARYGAYEAGEAVGKAFDELVEYVNGSGDKVGALNQYGVQTGQPAQ